mmetsp:Transcript_21662/g.71688  ORF Transcript_21662/g.71688 Transcript_21662/m.71688 type:complete len:615 (-) Transcript_21662:1056-2900(-)
MCVVEPADAEGQGRIVACCGAGDAGTLHIVHDGLDVTGTASRSPTRITNLSLILSSRGEMVIVSTEAATHAFLVANDGSTTAFPSNPQGFDETISTIYCCNLGDAAVQVTPRAISKFYTGENRRKLKTWRPKDGRITAATGNNGAVILISLSNGKLVLLDCDVEPIASAALDDEASCVALSPSGSASFKDLGMAHATAVSVWSDPVSCVSVYDSILNKIHDPTITWQDKSSNEQTLQFVRALVLSEINEKPYLFCASGDGLVTVYQFACGNDVVTTTRLRAVSLGVLPARVLILGAFDRMARSVLCFSDRACVVRRGCASHLQWVVASAKAFGETTEWRYYIVVPLHKKATTAILACGSQFAICKIDANQGIKVVSVPLAEQPLCICHDLQSHLFAVCTIDHREGDNQGVIRFLRDEAPYNDVHREALEPLEIPLCCSIISLDSISTYKDQRAHFVVGTAFAAQENDFEPCSGRMIIFRSGQANVAPSVLFFVEANGAVYDVAAMRASLLVCAVNHAIHIYDPVVRDNRRGHLKPRASYDGLVVALKVQCYGNLIVVGDMMRSVTLLNLIRQKMIIVEVSHISRFELNPLKLAWPITTYRLHVITTPIGCVLWR